MTKCWNHCGMDITFDDSVKGKTGKKIPLNLDGTRHDCPNSSYNKRLSQSKSVQPQESHRLEPTVTTANELFEKDKVDDAKRYIAGLNERLTEYKLELVIKEKGVV